MKNSFVLAFKLALFLGFSIIQNGFCYVQNKTSLGKNIRWKGQAPSISINVLTTNNDGLTAGNVLDVIQNSADQWSQNTAIKLNIGQAFSNGNTIHFSSDSSLGTGVLGVTSVAYDPVTGYILESEIEINDQYNLNTTANSTDPANLSSIFLGDIVTHELGHFLGLGHSQTEGSSMVYTIFNGHYQIHEDDIHGANRIYSSSIYQQGKIIGTVIGGSKKIPVFGANVSLISHDKGEVIATTFSSETGTFEFYGLDLDDTYYIYTSPINLDASPPEFFASAKINYCPFETSYRGSFFSSCDPKQNGFPQGIHLSSVQSSYDVGYVTIRCDFDTPAGYLDVKDENPRSTIKIPVEQSNSSFGNTFTGYFNSDELLQSSSDTFSLDLRNYVVTSTDLYLDVKLLIQELFSPLRISMSVTNADLSFNQSYNSGGVIGTDTFGNPDFNISAKIPLSMTTSLNVFTITLTAQTENYGGYNIKNVFAANISKESLSFYLFRAAISKQVSGIYTIIDEKIYDSIENNSLCSDAPNTRLQKAFVSTKDIPGSGKKLDSSDAAQLAGCGTIDLSDKNDPGGPFSLLIGLLLSFGLFCRKRVVSTL